ncbi:MAG: tetratricopeptide repeat protein, partial [Candidatus Eisenbacteria bacterium]|nr:tetratricopeptide repeat protein [Candidatus Eisenbacteria bacterium]
AQIETEPVSATHIAPAVEELFSAADARVDSAAAGLAEQDVETVAVDICVEPQRYRLTGAASLAIASPEPFVELRLRRDLTVLSVSSEGRALSFQRDGEALTVRPGALAGDEFEIEVRYEGLLTPGPDVRLHRELVILGGQALWYPTPRPGDRCALRTIVRYPDGYTSVCTGALAGMTPSRADSTGGCVLGDVWDTGVPVGSGAVAVGTLSSSYSVWGDVFLGYHVHDESGATPRETMDAFMTELKGLVRYLESCYGEYPFEWLSVVYAPGFPAGLPAVETAPGFVVLTDLQMPSGRVAGPRPERVVRGLSKSWWPHSTDAGRIVSEGLAAHAELSLLGESGDEESVVRRRLFRRNRYIAALADSGGRAPLSECIGPDVAADPRVCNVRSEAFIRILEHLVGRETFCAALAGQSGEHRGEMLPLREFVAALEEEDGRELEWLVYEWICRGDLPTYVLTYDVTPEGDGYLVEGTIAQRGEIFRTPVPVTVDLGVWSYENWVPISSSEQPFEFTTELEPQSISIDSGDILLRIEADELAGVHYEKGLRAADANEWGRAVDEFGAATELAPGNPDYAFHYGRALVHSGRLELGLEAMEGSVREDPSDADAGMELATLYLASGRSESALPHLERYVELRPSDPAGHALLAKALVAMGRFDAAERELSLASSLVDSVETTKETLELLQLAAGRYYEAAGDTALAAGAYRQALELNPVSDEARRALTRLRGEGAGR